MMNHPPAGSSFVSPGRAADDIFETLAKADLASARNREMADALRELELTAEKLARQFQPWQSVAEKAEVWQARDAVERARAEYAQSLGELRGVLDDALACAPTDRRVRRALADFHWSRSRVAAAAEPPDLVGEWYHLAMLGRYDDGRYARERDGVGGLELETDPSGAQVTLHRYVERGCVLSEEDPRDLGPTPIACDLPAGSYLLRITAPGRAEIRYPIVIGRNEGWSGRVRLYSPEQVGDGFVHVAAGPYWQGGDPETRGWGLPGRLTDVDDFFLARHPVTMREYLEFLNDLPDAVGAESRSPRLYPDRGSYLVRDPAGRLVLPDSNDGPATWEPALPVFGVSWHDAVAYCQWRSARDGRSYRLPTETEWEKAARGVDRRFLPWGNRFDASLCNMRDSHPDGPRPVPVTEYPTDVSPYGVFGLAGNVRDWTSSQVAQGTGVAPELGYRRWRELQHTRVVRGGAWSPLKPRITDRYWLPPSTVLSFIGFRLASSDPAR